MADEAEDKERKNQNKQQKDINKLLAEQKSISEDIQEVNKRITADISSYLSTLKNVKKVDKEIYNLEKEISELGKDAVINESDEYKNLQKQLATKQRIISNIKGELNLQNAILATASSTSKIFQNQGISLNGILSYFNEADKSVRKLNLSLGVSGKYFDGIRTSVFQSASYAAQLGLSVGDLANSYKSYADETGRLVMLSKESLKAISQIAAGTAIGAENAGMMVGQFELIGKNAEQTRDFYENLVNSSEKFGINSSKVIKLVNDNFKKAQQYVFKGGVKALGDMARFAEKFKVDMTGTFSAIDKARGLEGAVDMAAQLQVIGGEFSKTDPFQLLFQARNDAAGFQKTIQRLTNNLTTFNKETGEFDIAAGNLDRLRLAADATGISFESLIEQTKRGAKVNMIEGMVGGLTRDNKDFISSIAEIQKGGKIVITMPDGTPKDIRALTNTQIDVLRETKSTLEERAKQSRSFDEMWLNTINSLKGALLPILQMFSRGIDWLNTHQTLFTGLATALLAFATIPWMGNFIRGAKEIVSAFRGSELLSKTGGTSIGDSTKNIGKVTPEKISSVGKAASGAAKGMLAFGAAILMVGGAISLAAIGLAKLVESFKVLTGEQVLGAVISIIAVMGGFVGLTYALAGAVAALGVAGTAGAVGLIALGAAVVGIGFGINLASKGIATMVDSFSNLINSFKVLGDPKIALSVMGLSGAILPLALGMTALGNPLALLGAYALVKTFSALSEVKGIDRLGDNFTILTNAVGKIDVERLDKLKETVDAISEMNNMSNSIFGGLNKFFGNNVMEVKFSDEKVALNVDITNTIDGNILGSKISRRVQLALENNVKEGSSRTT